MSEGDSNEIVVTARRLNDADGGGGGGWWVMSASFDSGWGDGGGSGGYAPTVPDDASEPEIVVTASILPDVPGLDFQINEAAVSAWWDTVQFVGQTRYEYHEAELSEYGISPTQLLQFNDLAAATMASGVAWYSLYEGAVAATWSAFGQDYVFPP